MSATPRPIESPSDMVDALAEVGYMSDDGLATVAYLAYQLRRPLFLEGDPGVGKTHLARALAEITGTPLLRLQCYEGIDRRQAIYDWNFPRQMLHLRAAGSTGDPDAVEGSLYDRKFLIARPLLQALEAPATLLIDEIDRADDEFEAFLLETLAEGCVTVPELGTITATELPWVVITSNRTRDVHDALKRRCFYHWVGHPDLDREVAIIRSQVPAAADKLVRSAADAVARLRRAGLQKPPGISETVDWVIVLHHLGCDSVEAAAARHTWGVVLKDHDDIEQMRVAVSRSVVN